MALSGELALNKAEGLGCLRKNESQNKQRLFPYTALTDWFL